jgi:hypothetical protein
MNIDDLLDEKFPDDIDETPPLSVDLLSKHMGTFESQHICDLILSIELLSLGNELKTTLMKELVLRRKAGDTFKYEDYLKSNAVSKSAKSSDIMSNYRAQVGQWL